MGTDIHGVFQKKTEQGWEDVPTNYEFHRHYMLFAWLGGVRNGFGFAGVPTHSPLVPLSRGRGLPPDFEMVDDDSHPISRIDTLSKIDLEYIKEYGPSIDARWDHYWMGDHSYSWVSAKEVLEAELPRLMKTGVVDRSFFDAWDGVSEPREYSGGISGYGVVVKDMTQDLTGATHIQIRWFKDMKTEFSSCSRRGPLTAGAARRGPLRLRLRFIGDDHESN